METIIFFVLSVLLIYGYIHEDWFVEKEDKALLWCVILVSRVCKKILQRPEKCGKLKQKRTKEDHYACHIKRVQSLRDPVCQQTGEWDARRAG